MIRKRALRTGDGTCRLTQGLSKSKNENEEVEHIWGWNDRDMTEEDKHDANIRKKI